MSGELDETTRALADRIAAELSDQPEVEPWNAPTGLVPQLYHELNAPDEQAYQEPPRGSILREDDHVK